VRKTQLAENVSQKLDNLKNHHFYVHKILGQQLAHDGSKLMLNTMKTSHEEMCTSPESWPNLAVNSDLASTTHHQKNTNGSDRLEKCQDDRLLS